MSQITRNIFSINHIVHYLDESTDSGHGITEYEAKRIIFDAMIHFVSTLQFSCFFAESEKVINFAVREDAKSHDDHQLTVETGYLDIGRIKIIESKYGIFGM